MCVSLLGMALIALTGCAPETAFPSSGTLPQTKAPKATPVDASFFMTVPFDPKSNQALEVKAVETAFVSIARMGKAIALANWEQVGWAIGATLGESDTVPHDCALHSRQGVANQMYAACDGPHKIAVPYDGGDFVYIVFTDDDNRVARVLQTGNLYNPDTTGLIP
jgi:hypothetical protein